MRVRNFPDFLKAYADYAKDNYCPDKFHFWTGISIVAAALERKAWTVLQNINIYPNVYVMLIAMPGDGKTTAAQRGIKLLREVKHPEGEINYLPPKITDAALVLAMEKKKRFFVGSQTYYHSSAYYFAGEASNSLREIPGGGDIFPTITEAYDCEDMEKSTITRGKSKITNPCMNVLACSTFNNLKGMLTEGGVMGGFASRFFYVVHDEKLIRRPSFDADEEQSEARKAIAFKLTQDLEKIHHLSGQFTVSDEFKKTFVRWFPKNDEDRYARETEKEQAFFARKHTSILKLAMIACVSDSDDMILEQRHWDRAIQLAESLETKFDNVVQLSYDNKSTDGLNANILMLLKQNGGTMSEVEFDRKLGKSGADMDTIRKTVQYMLTKSHEIERILGDGPAKITLGVNPQK